MAVKRILILDDDPLFAKMLADFFRASQYEVIETHHLDNAVRQFWLEKPKVILLDFNMPMLSAEKFLPVFQEMDPQVKAIVVTGELTENVKDRLEGLGYFAFFEKGGLSLERLKAKVDEALGLVS